ncbi:unnamed protein product [Caenorhabditis angaria]|uniref:Uncharacterized protein n=1 Tax=Caenorhabditis angaria TaxID=860376 RepID=A0A9P1N9U0_9PELO|nr:unnamed protein product [Caenorhabditis angaria]
MLTRAERAKKKEKKTTGEVVAPNKTGQWMYTPPPRQVRPNASTPHTTHGNANFERYSSDETEVFDEVRDPPVDVVVEILPQVPAAVAPIEPEPVVEPILEDVVQPVAEQGVAAEPVVVAESSGTESGVEEAAPAQLPRRRRRARRGRPRRNRRPAFVYPRPPVLLGDPHADEVLIDEFLPLSEDPTQSD